MLATVPIFDLRSTYQFKRYTAAIPNKLTTSKNSRQAITHFPNPDIPFPLYHFLYYNGKKETASYKFQ